MLTNHHLAFLVLLLEHSKKSMDTLDSKSVVKLNKRLQNVHVFQYYWLIMGKTIYGGVDMN